jgi:hypothetical protein
MPFTDSVDEDSDKQHGKLLMTRPQYPQNQIDNTGEDIYSRSSRHFRPMMVCG